MKNMDTTHNLAFLLSKQQTPKNSSGIQRDVFVIFPKHEEVQCILVAKLNILSKYEQAGTKLTKLS